MTEPKHKNCIAERDWLRRECERVKIENESLKSQRGISALLAADRTQRERELIEENSKLREANRRLQAAGAALERDKLIMQLRAEIERLSSTPCPYVSVGNEGTAYCRLAEGNARELEALRKVADAADVIPDLAGKDGRLSLRGDCDVLRELKEAICEYRKMKQDAFSTRLESALEFMEEKLEQRND